MATAFGQIKTGGHKPISVSDEGVKDAADFALEIKSSKMVQEISLDGIVKAERQSVARTNYHLCLQLYINAKEDETDGIKIYIQTVIFKSLKTNI